MPADPPPRSRSLLPREHGAYGQLGVPLAVALASGRPGLSAIALAIATIGGFLSHEPALVLAGHRGRRARDEHGRRARRLHVGLAVLTAAAGTLGVASAGPPVAYAVGVVAGLAAVTGVLVAVRREKTLVGEALVASTLAAAAVPVALAGDVAVAPAVATWAAWTVGFAAVTAAVKDVIAHGKRRRGPWPRLLLAAVVGGAIALAVAIDTTIGASAPLLVTAIALALSLPSPRRLRQVGWCLVAATLATGACLVVLAHA